VAVLDEQGQLLASRRIQEGVEGWPGCTPCRPSMRRTQHRSWSGRDRPWPAGWCAGATGDQVWVINPRAVDRYRDRHGQAGAKSDGGDANVLADLVGTDRHQHRRVAGDSELAEAIKILARSHHNLIWTRQRLVNQLGSTLREFSPAALVALAELTSPEALAVLAAAPTRRVVGV
jgi:transposase